MGAGAAPQGGPWGPVDSTGKISKQVGWLNQQVVQAREKKISFSDVVGPLSMIDVTAAMKILKDVGDNIATVNNPTSYIVAAASRRGFGGFGGGKWSWDMAQGYNSDASRKISKHVGWLNHNGGLLEPLSYHDVRELLEMCDQRTAMKILKDLQDNAPKVKNPTAYVGAAAQRVLGGGGGGGGGGAPRKPRRVPNETSKIAVCWDFIQGHCPRGALCKYEHTSAPAGSAGREHRCRALAHSLGLEVTEEALLELASIPDQEATVLLEEIAAGGRSKKGIKNAAGYVKKACKQIRAEAFGKTLGAAGGDGATWPRPV